MKVSIKRSEWDLEHGVSDGEVWVKRLREFAKEVIEPEHITQHLPPSDFKSVNLRFARVRWVNNTRRGSQCIQVPLWINFNATDKRLIEDFAHWLKFNRPHRSCEVRGLKKRALKSNRADLIGLGILRLSRATGSVAEAIRYAEKNGRVFYSEDADCYAAKSRAVKLIQKFNSGADPLEV